MSRVETRCVRCGTPIRARVEDRATEAPSFPFCSPRCKLVDLSKWISGSYRIAGEPLEDLDAEGASGRDVPSA